MKRSKLLFCLVGFCLMLDCCLPFLREAKRVRPPLETEDRVSPANCGALIVRTVPANGSGSHGALVAGD